MRPKTRVYQDKYKTFRSKIKPRLGSIQPTLVVNVGNVPSVSLGEAEFTFCCVFGCCFVDELFVV